MELATFGVKEMKNSVTYNGKREKFFDKINDEDLINYFFPITIKTRLNSIIRKFLSYTGLYTSIKSFLKKMLRK